MTHYEWVSSLPGNTWFDEYRDSSTMGKMSPPGEYWYQEWFLAPGASDSWPDIIPAYGPEYYCSGVLDGVLEKPESEDWVCWRGGV